MDSQWEAVLLNSEIDFVHSFLPNNNSRLYILGREYLSLNDRNLVNDDITSRIWCTYRKNFKEINSSLTSDKGWGCMHRCGQMLIAECLIRNHLSRDWRWNPNAIDKTYWKIIKKFEDRISALYSIHSIAMMGVSENKSVGEWLGPNTVSNILKKLVSFDNSNKIKVYVTNEEGVIYDEIKKFATSPCTKILIKEEEQDLVDCQVVKASDETENSTDSDDSDNFISKFIQIEKEKSLKRISQPSTSDFYQPSDGESDTEAFEVIHNDFNRKNHGNSRPGQVREESPERSDAHNWNPLLLLIPVRFGLNNLIPQYFNCIKTSLEYSSSVGILGGRPSHAQWYIGYIENSQSSIPEMICLDPHTTQEAARFNSDLPSSTEDSLFHCSDPTIVNLSNVDPSMSFGFFFKTQKEFDQFAETFSQDVINQGKYPLTGFYWTRPDNFRWKEQNHHKNTENNSNVPVNSDYELV